MAIAAGRSGSRRKRHQGRAEGEPTGDARAPGKAGDENPLRIEPVALRDIVFARVRADTDAKHAASLPDRAAHDEDDPGLVEHGQPVRRTTAPFHEETKTISP